MSATAACVSVSVRDLAMPGICLMVPRGTLVVVVVVMVRGVGGMETVKQRDGRMWLQQGNGIIGALYQQL